MVARHLPEYVDDRAAGSYFPNPDPGSSDRFMTWQYVVDARTVIWISSSAIPSATLPIAHLPLAVRAKYDGLENYIRHVRLGWPTEERTGPAPPNMLDRPQKRSHLHPVLGHIDAIGVWGADAQWNAAAARGGQRDVAGKGLTASEPSGHCAAPLCRRC